MQKNLIIYICTRALNSFHLSRSLHRHTPAAQGHLHTIHSTERQSALCPPSTYFRHRHPSRNTSLIHSLQVSNPSQNSLIYSPRTSSFQTLSLSDTPTKQIRHFISRIFTFLLSALLMLHAYAPYNGVCIITPSYRHFFPYIAYPLLISTKFSTPQALYPSSLCVPHPFHILHPMALATPGT